MAVPGPSRSDLPGRRPAAYCARDCEYARGGSREAAFHQYQEATATGSGLTSREYKLVYR